MAQSISIKTDRMTIMELDAFQWFIAFGGLSSPKITAMPTLTWDWCDRYRAGLDYHW